MGLFVLCICTAGAFWRQHSGPDSVQWRSGRSGTAAGGLHCRWELLYLCGVCRAHTGLHTPCRWHSGKKRSDWWYIYSLTLIRRTVCSDRQDTFLLSFRISFQDTDLVNTAFIGESLLTFIKHFGQFQTFSYLDVKMYDLCCRICDTCFALQNFLIQL